MGFRQADKEGKGGFARIWTADDKGNYSLCKISTSRKKKDEDGYETDFQDGYVRFIGAAHNKVKKLNVPEKGIGVQLTSCEVTAKYDKDKNKTFVNYLVYDFETLDGTSPKAEKPAKKTKPKKAEVDDSEDDSDLPF